MVAVGQNAEVKQNGIVQGLEKKNLGCVSVLLSIRQTINLAVVILRENQLEFFTGDEFSAPLGPVGGKDGDNH